MTQLAVHGLLAVLITISLTVPACHADDEYAIRVYPCAYAYETLIIDGLLDEPDHVPAVVDLRDAEPMRIRDGTQQDLRRGSLDRAPVEGRRGRGALVGVHPASPKPVARPADVPVAQAVDEIHQSPAGRVILVAVHRGPDVGDGLVQLCENPVIQLAQLAGRLLGPGW